MKTRFSVILAAIVGFGLGSIAIEGLHAQGKPPVYTISEIDVSNVEAYGKDYAPKVQALIKKMGGKQDDFVRLYMAPGMQHCAGGPGPNQINFMAIMERWRENNQTPAAIEAVHVTNNRVDMTRPLCAYPQVAVYKGSGSPNDAANFTCK